MELLVTVASWMMPACMTFGPLFLVVKGKTPKYERILRGLGVVMVILALSSAWLTLQWQRGEISLLQQRLDYVERCIGKPSASAALSAPSN